MNQVRCRSQRERNTAVGFSTLAVNLLPPGGGGPSHVSMRSMISTMALVSQKGGSGKTTLALALAMAHERAGGQAVVIDLDPQGSAAMWGRLRHGVPPVVISAHPPRLARVIAAAADAGATLAVWLRPYVQPGGDRRSGGFQDGTGSGLKKDGTGSGFSAYAVFEEMRAAGKVSIRWSSLLRYLPLAEHDWKTITEHAHTVKGALKWCADFKRTPEEREAAKYARRDTRADHDRRNEGHIREIRTLKREVSRLQDEVDTDLAAEVAKLRAQVCGLKTDIQAKDRQIARLRKDAAHHRLSARGGPLKEVGKPPRWCNECASPPSDCECGSVPEVTANGNGAGRADLFAHAVVSLPGEN